MNYDEENYVRLYTRRTLTSVKLSWQGRAVLHEVMKIIDLSGVLEVGEQPAEALALLIEMPFDVVQDGLAKLLATKTWELRGTTIVWPTFEEAQTCARSDRLRSADYRARKRTSRDDSSRGVTGRHAEPRASRNVTLPSTHPPIPPPTHSSGATVVVAPEDPEPESPDDPGHETVCPMDIVERAERNGVLAELAARLPAPIDAVRHEAREFLKYWTLGDGAGRRRTTWMRRLRQRICDQHGKGQLQPAGALAHAGRPPNEPIAIQAAPKDFEDQEREDAERLRKALAGEYGEKLKRAANGMPASRLRAVVEALERKRAQPVGNLLAGIARGAS